MTEECVLAFTKMRVKPMVFDVPVLILCSKMGRIRRCNVQSGLVVFKCMTDEGYTVAWNSEGGSDFLEDVTKRDKSTHSRSNG